MQLLYMPILTKKSFPLPIRKAGLMPDSLAPFFLRLAPEMKLQHGPPFGSQEFIDIIKAFVKTGPVGKIDTCCMQLIHGCNPPLCRD